MRRGVTSRMYEEFTQDRIVKLRTQKGVSARDMSLSLGQNSSYINQIENKKALPSLQGLFYICEYFQISPQEFFNEGNAYPARINELAAEAAKLDERALNRVIDIVKEINDKN